MTEPIKTERQFLKENHTCDDMLFKTHAPDGIHLSLGQRIEKAIREFAAQQVAAERERIKDKVKKFQPDFDKAESYQHGFHDAIQVLIDSL